MDTVINREGRIVIASPETADGRFCVDIYRSADGVFAWDEWRREPEDPSGWQATGRASAKTFETAEAAGQAAEKSIEWLSLR